MDEERLFRYRIFDPTGNITILVESAVAADRQPTLSAALMRRHPEVEQVGFVQYASDDGADPAGELRMAGGEFCGNASMCASALCLLRREEAGRPVPPGETALRLRVSGAAQPVKLRLRRESEKRFCCAVRIPPARAICAPDFSFEGLRATLSVVEMEGISHVILEQDSPLFALRDCRAAAGRAVRAVCAALGADGVGFMFLDGSGAEPRLTPLVYIPGSGTEFWENSCASGSAAVGMYLASRSRERVTRRLRQPGGVLQVSSEPGGETWLTGTAALVASCVLPAEPV